MKNLKIMHLADLHYTDVNKKEMEYIRSAILCDLDDYIVKNNLLPDFLIFSGDLVFKPNESNDSISNFNNCFEFFIKPILDKLNLTNNDIFITSGNHDINRNILSRGDKKGILSFHTCFFTFTSLLTYSILLHKSSKEYTFNLINP